MTTLDDNLQVSQSTSFKKLTSSGALQERVLAQLNSGSITQTRPRPRNLLSKFTISSSNPSPSCLNLIPAYRTCAREGLPILSSEDKRKLNISPVSGLPFRNNCSSSQKSRLNSSPDGMKTRKCLLQKKTIHRSLEDLSQALNKRNHSFSDDPPPSSRSRNCVPLCSRNAPTPPQRHVCSQDRYSRQERIIETEKPASSQESQISHLHQQKRINSLAQQTDNIISTNEESRTQKRDGVTGPGGDSIPNILHQSNLLETTEEMEGTLRNLSIENEILKKRIKEERKKCIFYRIVNAFAFEALRRRSERLAQLEQCLLQRREECAARVILHHLLLNSWKMTKGQATAISLENTQMHKTIDNQSLQLNVIRKMQSIEKDKTTSVMKDYNEVKRNYCLTTKENEVIKEEYAKVLEEKRSLEIHLRSLSDENSRLNTDLQIRLDKKEMQLRSMELDRFQAEKFSLENEQLAKETEHARMQIKELTTQRTHWQEKAMSYESKCHELKQEMENKDNAYTKVLYEKIEVTKEKEILTLSKSKLEKAVEEAQVKLVENTTQKKQLEKSYTECKEELEDLEDQVEYLQSALRQYKKENIEIRQKLYDCTLKNVKRRRVWGAALYFLVNPIEAFKRFYFGTPEELQTSHIHHHHQSRVRRLSAPSTSSATKTEKILVDVETSSKS